MNPKKALIAYRKKQGLSVEECAKRLGVSSRTLQRWEGLTPEVNHGEEKVWDPPRWLMRFVERNFKLPEIKP